MRKKSTPTARSVLTKKIADGEKLLSCAFVEESTFDVWTSTTIELLVQICGVSAGNTLLFRNSVAASSLLGRSDEGDRNAQRKDSLKTGIAILHSCIEQLQSKTAPARPGNGGGQHTTKGHNGSSVERGQMHFDVAIVCALPSPELEKVRDTGAQKWTVLPSDPHDQTTYYQSIYTTKLGHPLRVIAAAASQMGPPAAAVLASKMILRFRPKLVAMVGIAAGTKRSDQQFGDILAAEHTFDWGSGKLADTDGAIRFEPDPQPLDIHPRLRDRLKAWGARDGEAELHSIRCKWPDTPPAGLLRLHVGPLASGSSVINHSQPVQDIKEHWRKLIGIEMEAYAVHFACRNTVDPQPVFLGLKSVCDFATKKEDSWQKYAAFTSAEFCHSFLIAEWENLHLR